MTSEEGVGEGSTLLDPTDRPTPTPTDNSWELSQSYLSIRLTVGHQNDKPICERLLGDVPNWIFYRHGNGVRREHYHICVPVGGSDGGRTSDKLRNRIKRVFNLGGNKDFSIVHKDNGLHSFIFYCSHEETEPVMQGDWTRVFEKNREVNGDTRYVKETGKKRHFDGSIEDSGATRKVRNWILTYSNLVPQAVLHSKRTKQDYGHLKFCVKNMIETTNWRPSPEMLRKGVPEFYCNDYQRQMDGKKPVDMSWWDMGSQGHR